MLSQETSEEVAAELLPSYQHLTAWHKRCWLKMYALTNSMAEIMMMSRATKGRPTKGKEQQKKKTKLNKNTQTKPDLSNWSKFNVVTVTDYPGTKDRQRSNGASHSWSPDTVNRSASKLTSSQLFINEIFHNK